MILVIVDRLWLLQVFGTAFLLQAAMSSASGQPGPSIPDDPAVTFSSNLSLPPAQGTEWAIVREAIGRGDLQKAESLIGSPSTPAGWLWKGVLLLHQRKTFASILAFEKSAQASDNSTVETLLATDYLLLNQRLLVEDALERALKLNALDSLTLYVKGRLYFIGDDFSRARAAFAAVVDAQPTDYHSLYYLGLSEWRLGQRDAAQRYLLRAVHVLKCHHIGFPPAPLDLARLALELGQPAQALTYADLALEMATRAPDSDDQVADVLVLRGKIRAALGQWHEAESVWQKCVNLNNTLAEGWYLLGRAYQARGDSQAATEALAQFRRIKSEM